MLNNIKRLRESEKGFTLIELMIVMVVLGVLAGIVVFAVGTFQTDATTSKNSANTRICATAKAAASASAKVDTYKDFIEDQTLSCP